MGEKTLNVINSLAYCISSKENIFSFFLKVEVILRGAHG